MLRVTGLVKLEPLSFENAISSRGISCAPVNQATAARSPLAATAAALVGQALISQLSAFTILGVDHFPFSRRVTAMSRMSSLLCARKATSSPLEVFATAVGQQPQT